MQCSRCNEQNKPDARFCAYCGFSLVDEPESLQAGQLMDSGTYKIIRPLGQGGMGAVYLAANTKAFGRKCVVKEVIQYYDINDPAARDKALTRFETEARMLASLKYQSIPDIYAYFSENGRTFLVMEYIEGPNLAEGLTRDKDGQVIKGRPLPAKDVIRHTIQICEVLNYLEQCQPPVMHNDIKPANIILDSHTGRAALVDFGTAKARYSQPSAGQPGKKQSSVYGTVGYAAPELYEGQAESRSDVYAIAATAYHLLTDDDPRLHPFHFPHLDAIPEPLCGLLREALAVEIKDRPFASEFGSKLSALLQSDTQPLPGLTFPDDDKASDRENAISLSVKHWDYATGILYDGSLSRWLSETLHDPAAARMAQQATERYAKDRNAGLEYFVRSLDPRAMPEPKLEVLTGRLSYDRVVGGDSSQQLKVKNSGGGYLYGLIQTSEPWVEVKERLACAPGKTQLLLVVVHADGLLPGRMHQAKITIHASGAQSVVIPVQVKLPAPVVSISPLTLSLTPMPQRPFTERRALEITNQSDVAADCHIQDVPAWLTVSKSQFICPPYQTRAVEVLGLVDKLPDKVQPSTVRLVVHVAGTRARYVQVSVQPAIKEKRGGGELRSYLGIGCIILVVLGIIAFVVIMALTQLLGA